MDWPLKIQGRLLSEADVDEIRSLLMNNHCGIDPAYPVSYVFAGAGNALTVRLKTWPAVNFFASLKLAP